MTTDALDDLFALLDCVPTAIFVMDVAADGCPRYAHYNTAALRKLGRPLSDFIGKTTVEAFGVAFGTAAFDEQRKTIAAREPRAYEFELPFGDEIRIVRTTLSPQVDNTGTVTRLIGSSDDVSHEWIAQSTQVTLSHISSEVEQFIAMAAHDLRTPMRNVIQLTELLQDGFEDHGDGKVELIDLLRESSEKSMDLISDVLSYANSLGPQGTTSLYRLDQLAQDIMLAIDPRCVHRLDCDAMTLSGERHVMQIVLRNLIDNAIKHGNRAQMHLRCTIHETGDNDVEVTLSDNGKGFDSPGTAFLNGGTFRVDSGYGLLAIRKLVAARGGVISAQNDPVTGGSCVRFTLPHRRVTTALPPPDRDAVIPHALGAVLSPVPEFDNPA